MFYPHLIAALISAAMPSLSIYFLIDVQSALCTSLI